jgi:hypothetical protein
VEPDQRADYCLRKAFADRAGETAAARERLVALDLPRPAIDPSLASLLPNDSRAAWRILVNPVRRALFFARHELAAIMPELHRAAGSKWRGRLVSIRLTTSAQYGRAFTSAVDNVLGQLHSSIGGLDLNLVTNGSVADTADVVIACGDPQGKIRRIYSNRQGLFWNRASPAGSTAKMVAAVALGRVHRSDTPYCPAPIPATGSAETSDVNFCRDRKAWISAKEAFARSHNGAVHWALRQMRATALRAVMTGFSLPPSDVPPATALTIGTFELTPAAMLRVAALIGAGLTGTANEFAGLRLIDEITLLDTSGQAERLRLHDEDIASELRGMFTPRVRSFVASVLRATSDRNGTLRALGPLRDQLHGALYAKTGTVSVSGSTLNLHIAGTYTRGGKPWSFVVTVGSRSAAHPLGRRLVAGRFAPLVAVAVCNSASHELEVAQTRSRRSGSLRFASLTTVRSRFIP